MSDTAESLPLLVATMSLPRDPRLYTRDHATNLREAFGDAARFHHEQHIPRHFMDFAAAKYGYKPRTSKYLRWKARTFPGRPALVLTGRTQAVVTGSRQITKTQKGSRLRLRFPSPAEGGGFGSATGRLRLQGDRLSVHQKEVLARIAEIQVIAPDESRRLAECVRDDYTRRANLPGTRYRKTFGTA